MSTRTLKFLHTSATLVPVFEQLCKMNLPGVRLFNLVDDSLVKDVIAHGRLRPITARRVAQHVAAAEDAGAEYIVVTCSSIGTAVDIAAGLASAPVLRGSAHGGPCGSHGDAHRRDCNVADDVGANGRPDIPSSGRRR